MRRFPLYTIAVAAVVFLRQVFPTSTLYCDFKNINCIDGLAQSSTSFRLNYLSPTRLSFFYGFDAGPSPQDGTPSIKVSYWLQYDPDAIRKQIQQLPGTNRTTEIALRVGNLQGWVGGHHHGCEGVWGSQCSQSLKSFLQFSIYNLSASGVPYDSPLETVLKQLMNPSSPPSIPGCPSTFFQLNDIPTYPFINETSVSGQPNDICIAESGNQFSPWRTWYIPNTTPQQQAMQIAVGIVTRGPKHGSEPLHGPQDVDVELLCTKAPKQISPDGWSGDYDDPGHPPGMPPFNPVLGNRATIVDAFDFDSDYDFYDDEEADEDCTSSEI